VAAAPTAVPRVSIGTVQVSSKASNSGAKPAPSN
jgi:hypothetical protein